MKHYFKTGKFKVLVLVLVLLLALMVAAGISGRVSGWPGQVLGTLATPFQKTAAAVEGGVRALGETFVLYQQTQKENEELEKRVGELEQKLVELDRYKAENQQLKDFYDIQQQNPEWDMVSASVVGRDPIAQYYSFTIDQGSLHGIQAGNPVIGSGGSLVGVIKEVGPNYAVVTTILNPALSAAAMISRTRDSGLAGGDAQLSQQGFCSMVHLARDASAVVGDMVITTGLGGVFPKELRIGTVQDVLPDASGKSLYAVLKPEEDVSTIRSVMVVTSFTP